MRYFKVIAKCGHVGRNKYVLKAFYRKALNRKEAARLVRNTPRVKHNHKDAIREVFEISPEDYARNMEISSKDPYFNVHSKQEQKHLCPNICEFVCKEEGKQTFHKRRLFRRVKYAVLEKEASKEIKGGYLYEQEENWSVSTVA